LALYILFYFSRKFYLFTPIINNELIDDASYKDVLFDYVWYKDILFDDVCWTNYLMNYLMKCILWIIWWCDIWRCKVRFITT